MIYTTYYAKLRKLPDDIAPIAISLTVPDGIIIPTCKALCPPQSVLWEYKRDNNTDKYIYEYAARVLANLNANDLVSYLHTLGQGKKDIALVCYESPEKFCHRHIVAEWLKDNGFDCKEYEF